MTPQEPDELDRILEEVFEVGYQQGQASNTGAIKLSLKTSHFKARLNQLLLKARKDELKKLEQYSEIVSPDRINMVGIHVILDRIAELDKEIE